MTGWPSIFRSGPAPGRTAAEHAATLSRMIRRGARGALAERWTAEAAHAARGGGDDELAVARLLAERVARSIAYVRDEYGRDDPQEAEATVDRTAGDCEDLAILYGALALRAGFRVGLAFLLDDTAAPVHVLPLVERPGRPEWLPVELSRRSAFGVWPQDRGRYAVYAVVPEAGPTVGFIGQALAAVAGAVGSIVGGSKAAKAAKQSAELAAAAQTFEAASAERVAAEAAKAAVAVEAERTRRTEATLTAFNRVVPTAAGALVLATVGPRVVEAVAGLVPRRRRS